MEERVASVMEALGFQHSGGRDGEYVWSEVGASAVVPAPEDEREAGSWYVGDCCRLCCEDCGCSREMACSRRVFKEWLCSCTWDEWKPRCFREPDNGEDFVPCFVCAPEWAADRLDGTAPAEMCYKAIEMYGYVQLAAFFLPCAVPMILDRLEIEDGEGATWISSDGTRRKILTERMTNAVVFGCVLPIASAVIGPQVLICWPVLGAVTAPCCAGTLNCVTRAQESNVAAREMRLARRDAIEGAAEMAALREKTPQALGQLPPQLKRFKLEWRADSESLGIRTRRRPHTNDDDASEDEKTLELSSLKGLPKLDVGEGIDVLVRLGPDADVEDRRLPVDSSFGGDVTLLSSAEAGVELADGLSVAGELSVVARGGLSWVGANVRVNGDLRVREATPSLVQLPSDLRVGGAWDLRYCTALEALPDTLEVAVSINLEGCTSIEQLPANLGVVLGDLILTGCTALRSLPPGLRVYGCLILNGCTSLQYIPETVMPVGRELDIRDCAQLEVLPLEVLTSAALQGERPLQVRLNEGTGLADDVVEAWAVAARLPDMEENGGWLFHYTGDDSGGGVDDSMEARAAHIQAPSWSTLADVAREFDVQVNDLTPYIDKAYISGVVRFLSMLLGSAEFRSENLRPGFKARVKEVLELLAKDETVREEVVLRMLDALDACNDKPVWALGQMHVVKAIAEARGDRKALRKLGRRVLRLGIVHEHVEAFINGVDSRAVDDVCVYLRFEIALKSELDLPVSSSAMIYPDHVRVSAAVIKAAAKEAKAVSDERFEAWLVDWPEWQRQLRLEAVPAYQNLVMETETDAETETEREEPVNLEGEPISDPVLLLPDVANVWSYTELTAHWVKTGLNFSNEVVSETGFAQRVRRLHNVEPRQGRLSLSLKRLSLTRLSKRLSSRFNPEEEEEDVEDLEMQAAPEPEEDFQR